MSKRPQYSALSLREVKKALLIGKEGLELSEEWEEFSSVMERLDI